MLQLSLAILFVAYLFHPIHDFAVERLLDGDVGHIIAWRGAVPMFFARWKPDNIAGTYFFDGSTLPLSPSAA